MELAVNGSCLNGGALASIYWRRILRKIDGILVNRQTLLRIDLSPVSFLFFFTGCGDDNADKNSAVAPALLAG